jgi:hypothetical protein
VRRGLAIIFMLFPLLWITWGWEEQVRDNRQALHFQDISPAPSRSPDLGPFELSGLWRMSSPNSRFDGWSALLAMPSGQFLAMSDRNMRLRFTAPGVATPDIPVSRQVGIRRAVYLRQKNRTWAVFDIESAVLAPDESIWIGTEGDNRLIRIDRDRRKGAFVKVDAMKDWPINGGAEAMARLPDGRWIVLCETCGTRRAGLHLGLVFAGYPDRSRSQPLGIVLPTGHDPVDMGVLPDGRLLVLTRRFALFPPHFESALVLADPAGLDPARPWQTRELARIDRSDLRENYEAMAITSASTGPLVWLLSDANGSAFQQTRLMKLGLDMARLPK